MGKQVKIKKRNEKRQRLDSKDWFQWVLATTFLAIFLGLISGTSGFYLGTQELILGLYMDWQLACYIFGFAIWGLISYWIFKN